MKKAGILIASLLVGCHSSDSDPIELSHQALTSSSIEADNADLSTFIAATRGYDLIGLGESSHQGSKAFSYRSRMVKALHQDGDLDLVAFEAGLYDGLAAWQNYLTGKQTLLEAVTGPDANYMFMHRLSKEMSGLFNYINDVDQSNSPLILAGYEARITSDPGCSVMFDELEDYLDANSLIANGYPQVKQLAPRMMCPWYFDDTFTQPDHDILVNALSELEGLLSAQKGLESLPAYNPATPRNFREYASFWLQIAKSLKAFSSTRINNENYAYADYQSAENMRWLQEEWFNNQGQTLLWGHNIHATPLAGSVIDATRQRYPDVTVYSVMQLMHKGQLAAYTPDTSKWHSDAFPVETVHDSLNHKLYQNNLPDTFIDLGSQNVEQEMLFHNPQHIQLAFGEPILDLPNALMDGILFIPEEEPATPL